MQKSESTLHLNCAFNTPCFFTHRIQNTLSVILFSPDWFPQTRPIGSPVKMDQIEGSPKFINFAKGSPRLHFWVTILKLPFKHPFLSYFCKAPFSRYLLKLPSTITFQSYLFKLHFEVTFIRYRSRYLLKIPLNFHF